MNWINNKYFVLWGCLLWSLVGTAQVVDTIEWCPPGATWTYVRAAVFGEIYLKMQYEKDTMLNGILAKKIRTSEVEYICDPMTGTPCYRSEHTTSTVEFYYERNDSVFWYNGGQFILLYDFSAQPNDAWEIQRGYFYMCMPHGQKDTFQCDSIATRIYGGRQFNSIHGHSSGNQWNIGEEIIKNIGSLSTPYPQPGAYCNHTHHGMAGHLASLTCYYDDKRGFIEFELRSGRDCNHLLNPVRRIVDKVAEQKEWLVYPNPTNNLIFMQEMAQTGERYQYKLHDLHGRVLLMEQGQHDLEWSLAHLPGGIYWLTIQNERNQLVHTQKIVRYE